RFHHLLAGVRARFSVEGGERHQDAGRAEPALEAMLDPECFLDLPERTVLVGEGLDRADLRPVYLRREHQAGANGHAVDLDRAGATDAVLASDMRPREAQPMA